MYVSGGGPIMDVFRYADPENKGEITQDKFKQCLDRLNINGSVDNDSRKRLLRQFRGSSDN